MKVWKLSSEAEVTNTERLVEEFTAGKDVGFDSQLADYDLYGSIAHVTALEEAGLVSRGEAVRLRNELRNLLEAEIELSPEDEDIHTKVENELTETLGALGRKLHTGRSRNDQVLVDVRLYTKDQVFRVTDALFGVISVLLDFAEASADTPMVGYTHCRKAMPSSVGLWAGSFAESLLDDMLPLDSAYRLLDQSPLGVGAGYGVPVKLDRELTAELLGFGKLQNNAIYVMNSRGKTEFDLLAALAEIQLDLSRLAEDLITFSEGGFDYFELPDEFTTGSSIMPQKENPDVLELIRGRAAAFSGHLSELFSLIHGLRSGYNRDTQETKKPLLEGIATTRETLKVLKPLISGLEVNEAELIADFTEDVLATDRVFEKVRTGTPFREAYRSVKEELSGESKGEGVDEGRVRRAIESRSHRGGPGNPGLAAAREALKEDKKKWQRREAKFRRALKNLAEPEQPESGGG